MIINLFNNFKNKIRKKNRKKKSQFKLLLIWLTLIIIISCIFYIFNYYYPESIEISENKEYNNVINYQSSKLNTENYISKPALNPVKVISKPNIPSPKEIKLIDEILADVSKIPKPLNNVDNYNFEI